MATQLGVNEWTVGNWESGQTKPVLRFIPAIIRFLGYDPEPPSPTMIAEHLKAKRRDLGWSDQYSVAFYHHELNEAKLLESSSHFTGDAYVDAYSEAHATTLRTQGNTSFDLYHPSVVRAYRTQFNSNYPGWHP